MQSKPDTWGSATASFEGTRDPRFTYREGARALCFEVPELPSVEALAAMLDRFRELLLGDVQADKHHHGHESCLLC